MEFRLPELGEGIESATVTAVLVKPGDAVKAGQNVIAVETDKAAVEVPIETAGTIGQVYVKPGDKLPVGAPVLGLTDSGKPGAGSAAVPAKSAERKVASAPTKNSATPPPSQPVSAPAP